MSKMNQSILIMLMPFHHNLVKFSIKAKINAFYAKLQLVRGSILFLNCLW